MTNLSVRNNGDASFARVVRTAGETRTGTNNPSGTRSGSSAENKTVARTVISAAPGSSRIDTAELLSTLHTSARIQSFANTQTDRLMHGLHGASFREQFKQGQHNAWDSGDFSHRNHRENNGNIVAGRAGHSSLTRTHSRIDAHTESGGGFPVRWNTRTETDTQARLGTNAAYDLGNGMNLVGRFEAFDRLETTGSNDNPEGRHYNNNNNRTHSRPADFGRCFDNSAGTGSG